MALEDEIQKFIVKLNGGSGCLVQPLEEDRLYILTARHVLHEQNDVTLPFLEPPTIERFTLAEGEARYEPIPLAKLEESVNYFPHPHLDAAIIQVEMIPDFHSLLRIDERVEQDSEYKLCGYPGKREDHQPYRQDRVRIKNQVTPGIREATIMDGNPTLEEVKGQSGGGIIRCVGKMLLIGGVQSQMVSEDENELMGNINIIEISVFGEIVNLYNDRLVPLLPFYLKSFESFKKFAMELNNISEDEEKDVVLTRNYLQSLTTKVLESHLRPFEIKDRYGTKLLVFSRTPGEMLDIKLWTSWLELLIILDICEDIAVTSANLDECLTKIRLVHANFDENWIRHVSAILRSNFRGLKKGGVVVVSSPSATQHMRIKPEAVANIARGIAPDEFQIDQEAGTAVTSYTFVHIYAFQWEAILEKLAEYRDFGVDQYPELRAQLKKEFKRVLDAQYN